MFPLVILAMLPLYAEGGEPRPVERNPFKSCPVVNGVAKDNFGAPRKLHPHYGADILAPMGAPILAPFRGLVTNPRTTAGGLTVILTRRNGSYALGHHLSKHARQRKVVVGDIIGYVGKLKRLTSSPHLHLEWHPGGHRPVDPFPFLERLDCARFTQYSQGNTHTCGLVSDGTVRCWGMNAYGELGDGTDSDSYAIVSVAGISDATQIVSGGHFTCALLADSSVQCWGRNDLGQLGDGTTDDSNVPVAVVGLSGVTQISAGDTYACALLSDTTNTCWGLVA